jgi:hypothetical protein
VLAWRGMHAPSEEEHTGTSVSEGYAMTSEMSDSCFPVDRQTHAHAHACRGLEEISAWVVWLAPKTANGNKGQIAHRLPTVYVCVYACVHVCVYVCVCACVHVCICHLYHDFMRMLCGASIVI